MEPIIRRLSKRARILDGAQDQIVRLTKELEKRDSILSSVRQLVNVEGLTPITREEIRKQFAEYSIKVDSTMSQYELQSVTSTRESSVKSESVHKSSSEIDEIADKPSKRSLRGSKSFRSASVSRE